MLLYIVLWLHTGGNKETGKILDVAWKDTSNLSSPANRGAS